MVQPFLSNIRILDFSWAAAGPYATLLLSFMGAEVLKVESRHRPDLSRRGFYQSAPLDASSEFNDLNLNKHSISLNLQTQEGRDLVKRLVVHCDIVLENFRPGVMQRLGLDYARLSVINPRLIMASSSANGGSGPESAFAGYAGIFNALGGIGHLTGYGDGPPTEMRISMDLRSGLTLCFAVLTALYTRRRTGMGQHIDLSSREAITCLTGHTVLHYTMNGESPQRQGNDDTLLAPHGCYRCQGDDRWVSIAVGSEAEWRALCQTVGHPEWVKDVRFADAVSRGHHRDILDELLNAWTMQHTQDDVTSQLQEAGVAAYPTMDSATLATSEHLRARGVFITVDHAKLGQQTVLGPPWYAAAVPHQADRPGPLLGEHTERVLRDLLGLDDADLARLHDVGALE